MVTKTLNISSLKGSKAFNNSSIAIIALPHSSSHHTTDQLSRSLDTEALHSRSPNERCQVKPWIPLSEHHNTGAKMEMRILSSVRYGFTLVSKVQPRRDFQDQKALDLDLILKVSILHFSIAFQSSFIRARIRSTDGTDYRSIKPTKSRFCIERPHRASRVLGRGWGCGWSASAHPHPLPHRSTGNRRENHRKSCF